MAARPTTTLIADRVIIVIMIASLDAPPPDPADAASPRRHIDGPVRF
jgi:hypothetical protein